MNLPKIKRLMDKKDAAGDFILPDWVSDSDGKLALGISEILSSPRFNHEGWQDHDFYKQDAAYFIIEYLRGKI